MSDQPESDSKKQQLIRNQMVLILHAHMCKKRETDNPSVVCTIRHCKTMKRVLSHLLNCKIKIGCSTPHCSSSRQIITHFKNCNRTENCPVCLPFRSTLQAKNGNAQKDNVATSNTHTMEDPSNSPPQQTVSEIVDALQDISSHDSSQRSRSQMSNVIANDPVNSTSLPINIFNGQRRPLDVTAIKDWHSTITNDHRNNLVHKVVQMICPNLVAYAKSIERDMYGVADSQSQYYSLLAENICKIQQELKAKREKRHEHRMTPNQDASTTAAAVIEVQPTFYERLRQLKPDPDGPIKIKDEIIDPMIIDNE